MPVTLDSLQAATEGEYGRKETAGGLLAAAQFVHELVEHQLSEGIPASAICLVSARP